jgi:hypothetical protein
MLLNGIPLVLKKITGGRLVPPDYDAAEEWVIPPGGITPIWVYVFNPFSRQSIFDTSNSKRIIEYKKKRSGRTESPVQEKVQETEIISEPRLSFEKNGESGPPA